MKKTISKYFNTLRQAEKFREKLYNQFDSVKLIDCPLFEECGQYTFVVEQNL